jgi:uncharacterized damage-inducible protein DinB
MTTTPDLSYPVGRFEMPADVTPEMRGRAIEEIAALPSRLRDAVAGLSDPQLDTPYRPGGWTVRQVVHHVADSHLNSYSRMKVAQTEQLPTIMPYDEKAWAELPDMQLPVGVSLGILDGLHERWVVLLRALQPADYARAFRHPEYPDAPRTIEWVVQHYAWHSRHHVGHITGLRQREGW